MSLHEGLLRGRDTGYHLDARRAEASYTSVASINVSVRFIA